MRNDDKSYLFTEKASHLSVVLKQQSTLQIRLGLKKIAEAMEFLKNAAHISVQVSKDSIFVSPEGNWKIAVNDV